MALNATRMDLCQRNPEVNFVGTDRYIFRPLLTEAKSINLRIIHQYFRNAPNFRLIEMDRGLQACSHHFVYPLLVRRAAQEPSKKIHIHKGESVMC